MRLATWNVNSVKARLPRLLEWLGEAKPDVLALQEVKTTNALFPAAEVEALGYEVAVHGEGRWNGVALLSGVGLEDVSLGFPGQPSYEGEPAEATLLDEPGLRKPEARAVGATCGGIRVWSLYAPNGRTPDSAHYQYKLAWYAALQPVLEAELRTDPQLVACGDFNVAPTDADVWDPAVFVGSTPRDPAGTAGPGRPARSRAARHRAQADEGPASVHLLGLPGRRLRQGHGHAHRPGLRQPGRDRPGGRRIRGSRGPQGARAV